MGIARAIGHSFNDIRRFVGRCHKVGTSIVFVSLFIMAPIAHAEIKVETLSENSGPKSGGNIIVIKGSGFTATETEKFADIAAGVEHAVMLSRNGHVWTVGNNGSGQLGIGKIDLYKTTPQDITKSFGIDDNDTIIGVYSGDYYSFAISNKHRIFAWGDNGYGQLGDGTRNKQIKPVEITNNFKLDEGDYVTSIYAGVATTFAITNNGSTFVWGDSRDYIDGQTNEQYTPHLKPTNGTAWMTENMIDISVGNRSAIGHNANGMIATWGINKTGELGRTKSGKANDTSSRLSMFYIHQNLPLADNDRVVKVEAGNGVMAVLTKLHRVYIWGNGIDGMLGIGSDKPNPHDSKTGDNFTSSAIDITDRFDIAADDAIVDISIGNSQVIALSQYGEVFSWGAGGYGQLGNGNFDSEFSVTKITKAFNLKNDNTIQKVIAAGSADPLVASYSYALDSEGNVYAWGGSAKGLPGINMLNNRNIPTMISGRLASTVSSISKITFGEVEATTFDVISDSAVRVVVPNAAKPGIVSVRVEDKDNHAIELEKAYTYVEDGTASDANDELDDNAENDDSSNESNNDNSSKDDDGGEEVNSTDNTDNKEGENDDGNDDEESGNEQEASSIKRKLTSASAKILPPNTGVNYKN